MYRPFLLFIEHLPKAVLTKSAGDLCTMFSDGNLINRRNVKGDDHQAYTQCRDFLSLNLKLELLLQLFKFLVCQPKINESLIQKVHSNSPQGLHDFSSFCFYIE